MSIFLRAMRLTLLALAVMGAAPAVAATPAEAFVSDNIQKGLTILNDGSLSASQRDARFGQFLLGVTDLRRVATYTLGAYAAKASAADNRAFADAFQRYAVAVYQSYFAKYAGQTLSVTGSRDNGPDDAVVSTALTDSTDRGVLQVDFRVRSNTGAPTIVDLSVAGVWLAPEERDQFVSFLDHNNGSIPALIAHLDELRVKLGG